MVIGMDVGGTTARIRVADRHGRVLCEAEDQGGTLPGVGREELERRLGRLIRHALSVSGKTPEDCERLCIGASGVDTDEERGVYEEILNVLGFAEDSIMVINDAELLVRMFETPAAVLISGTGSIAVGRNARTGRIVRCGGWEHLLSDEGSATWLGMEILRAYVRLCDRRGEDTVFTELVEARTGFRCAQDAVDFCAQHIMEKADIAALAPLLEEGTARGSQVCRGILQSGAEELIRLAAPLVPEITEDGAFTLLLWGSVLLKNRTMQESVAEQAHRAWKQVSVCIPACTALDCAVLLARGEKTMPLTVIG